METVMAWHFTKDGRLRDWRTVPAVGEWLIHEGDVVICKSGLHASLRLRDALSYAPYGPGMELHRVECAEVIAQEADKLVCRRRRIVATMPAKETEHVLRLFARVCALLVVDKWGAPEIVTRYLWSGDESIRGAARDAAWAAARAAARAAVRDAARDAAWAAERDAERAAAWAAERDAERAAAWAAAWAAERDAAWAAAWAAARAAARAAVRDAAWDGCEQLVLKRMGLL